MHVLNYEMKRAHWALTWWAIMEFRAAGKEMHLPALMEMTPARYDILFAIRQRPSWAETYEFQVYQLPFAILVEKLGLHPSTISRCLDGLVALELVTRHVDPRDRRKRIYRLTKLGFETLLAARDVLFGELDSLYFTAIEAFTANGAAMPPPPGNEGARPRWLGDSVQDGTLIRFGRRLRQCAIELGSVAFAIFDPEFVDPYLLRFAAA